MISKANQLAGFYMIATLAFNELRTLQNSQKKSCAGVAFLVKFQALRSVGRQNKNNIIWFLGSVFKKENCRANTEEKLAIYNLS